jgi:hypothetical protein
VTKGAEPTLITLDERKRAPLGRLATQQHYLAHRAPSGRIVLEPAVVVAETELRLRDDVEFWARVNRALAEPTSELELDDF